MNRPECIRASIADAIIQPYWLEGRYEVEIEKSEHTVKYRELQDFDQVVRSLTGQ